MPRLTAWIDIAERRFAADGFMPGEIDEGYGSREGRGQTRLTSHRWLGPLSTDVRAAHIVSPRAEVLNVMGYPRHARRVPIFAMEVVLFGEAVRVAVVDLQPASLVAEEMATLQAAVRKKVTHLWQDHQPGLTHGGELPDWARDQFMPTCIYSRCEHLEELPQLTHAFEAYLQCWLDDFVPGETGEVSAVDHVAAYQRHHVDHTPGRPFLRSIFGQAWAEAYVSQFMYPAERWAQCISQARPLKTSVRSALAAAASL